MKKEILSKLYDTTRARKTTEEYNQLRKKLEKMKQEFLEQVGEEYEEKLEKITDVIYQMDSILSEEDFCNGFSMAVRLYIESTYNNKGDDQE